MSEEVYANARCAQCSSRPWSMVCLGCCLAFCSPCSDRKVHHCVRRDERAPALASSVPQKKSGEKKENG